ncbi:MAG TPA: RagB/SusD family nutrient uptake outer membrane protein, partial [Chitinophagaceae bacterium]|nr:RagB/SusD family nutrient uptake outer membrane protein [Chitinophagaceae bacterium]
MKKFISILMLACLMISAGSCKKDFLEKKPLDSYSDADLWKDLNLVQAFVNSRYPILPFMEFPGVLKSYFMSGACDEGNSKHSYGNERALETGQMSPDNTVYDFWANNYQQIRNCNIFLSKIDEVPAQGPANEAKKKRLTGEIYFLRAYGYFDLLRHYGGVPLVSKVYGLSDTTFKVARSTFEEGVTFVLNDIAKAVDLLPASYADDPENAGRATSVAAKALKSRLLLYAASALHNPANDQAKWQAASTAAKEAIDFAESNGYELYQGADYKNIFMQKNNSEVLLAYNFSNVPGGGIDIVCQPNSYGGWSVYTPSQAMVDAFEMNNGKPITDAASGYDAANPYINRDPRFYADILYNGAVFKGSAVEVFAGGKDSPQGPQGWNATETGYHWRKYMSETIDMNKEGSNQNLIIFRLAELYLNYAECEQALGHDGVARDYVNMIRNRASVNMPPVTESSTALQDRIRQERRVELCFESHRIYDVRRWKIASVTENKPLMGVSVT